MPFIQIKKITIWNNLSLRIKLSILYGILLIFSILVLGIYSYWNVSHLLIHDKSSHLRARAKPIIEHWIKNESLDKYPTIYRLSTHNVKQLARDLTSRNTIAIVLNKKGKIIANGKLLPEEPDPPIPIQRYIQKALAGEKEINYIMNNRHQSTLVLLIPIRPEPRSNRILGVIQLSTPLTEIKKTLFHHGLMLIGMMIIILFIGSLLSFWLTSSNLKNLCELTKACQQIAKGDFSRHIDLSKNKDEIGQLANSFNSMIEKLKATFSSQKHFVANAAHELLTPLTGLKGSLEVLLRGSQDNPKITYRLIKGMYQEVNRLIHLCEQLLGLTHLENSSNLLKNKFNIEKFFEDFLQQEVRLLTGNRTIILEKGPSIEIIADESMLKQILLNLLSNAIRHSLDNSIIKFGWKLKDDQIEIWVSDQGEGIDPEILSYVFEPFFRGTHTNIKKEKGTGLGLSLAKAMVKAHGGDIWIISKTRKGTTVFFRLPLK